jgi:hypothetical protein
MTAGTWTGRGAGAACDTISVVGAHRFRLVSYASELRVGDPW